MSKVKSVGTQNTQSVNSGKKIKAPLGLSEQVDITDFALFTLIYRIRPSPHP